MSSARLRAVLRSAAALIALAAVVDPSFTSQRSSRPEISVVGSSLADSALLRQTFERLANSFTVVNAPLAGAAATVLIGNQLPANANEFALPVFGVTPSHAGGSIELASLSAPTRAPLASRVVVNALVHIRGANGKTVDANLSVNGAMVSKVSLKVTNDDARIAVPLSFVPTVAGAALLRVSLALGSSAVMVTAERMVDVREKKWAVLFFDSRPSWMSTFVRRAIERDTRFVVTSRTVTSTNVSTDAGRPPAALNDPSVTELYDAIVVGAPDALSNRDADGLKAFLRARGGSVVLLFDENKPGVYQTLTDFGSWTSETNTTPTAIGGPHTDSIAMRATQWIWPARMPSGAERVAWNVTKGGRAAERPIVWRAAVGAGQLLVSGALDAWKFRDTSKSAFDAFWQTTIGNLADASPPAVELTVPSTPVKAGSAVALALSSRVAALATGTTRGVQSTASVNVAADDARTPVRVWPTAAAGQFTGSFRAPDKPGIYTVHAIVDGAAVDEPLLVTSYDAGPDYELDSDALTSWISASGGQTLQAADLGRLSRILADAVTPAPRKVSWYPMRSPLWLLPFGLLLSADWWLRRRRGLP